MYGLSTIKKRYTIKILLFLLIEVRMAKIFETFKSKNLEIKNRIVMAPMCMYMSDDTGTVTNFHLIHYGTRAIDGVLNSFKKST